jgi:preprotein translocase SecY subunit
MWCGIALLIYMSMGQVPLYGAPTNPLDPFAAFRVIFASQRGTLLELGIGPIVTGGLLMQLLKGSSILKLDFKNPQDRAFFTAATKLVTIIVIIVEGSIYGSSVYGGVTHQAVVIVIAQLIGASIIIMLLDELVQKGWGLGSGISLFILAGVAQGILWHIFNPFPSGADRFSYGVIPMIFQSIEKGVDFNTIFIRPSNAPLPLPSAFGLIITIGIILLLVYSQSIRIEIPIVSSRYRGFSAVYPIKLMYVSNIPVILASALTANAVLLGQLFWSAYNPLNDNPVFNWIAQFDPKKPSTPIGGIISFLIPPRGLENTIEDPFRAIMYVVILTTIVVIFGRLWVELGGLSAKSAASSLIDADVQIPGFRRAETSIESLLQKYIPSVTFLGALFLGLLASISDILGVFGTGTGLLLMIDILINYHNLLLREQVETYMPRLGALLGRK